MTQEEIEKVERMMLKLEEIESSLSDHFEKVRSAVQILSLWVEWAKIHGYANHAKGLIESSIRLIGK
jgi:hypothetical protein